MGLSASMQDFVDAIQAIPNLLAAVSSAVATPGGAIVLLMLILWPILNGKLSPVIDAFDKKRRRKLELLNEYASSPDLADPLLLETVKAKRDMHYFQAATTMWEEQHAREALVKAYKTIQHNVTWPDIRRARSYIDVAPDQSVSVREATIWERLGYAYNFVVGWFCILSAISIVFFALLHPGRSVALVIAVLIGALILSFAGMFVFSQNWSFQARKLIARELEVAARGSTIPE